MAFQKSGRHSKITGDFAEGLVLYWLSKYDYDCMRVDHVGIDLVACKRGTTDRMGISVKCRSRNKGTEHESVNLPLDGFQKASEVCERFNLKPFYAMVVDAEEDDSIRSGSIRCFLTPMDHLLDIASGDREGMRYWSMTEKAVQGYRTDPLVQRFELQLTADSWRDEVVKKATK